MEELTARARASAIVLAAILATLAASPSGAVAHYGSGGFRACGWITLAPQTDWGTNVRAKGTSCRTARRLAWDLHWFWWDRCDRCDPDAERADWAPRDGRVLKLYRCRSRSHDKGLSHTDRRCVPDGASWRSSRKAVVMAAY